MALSLDESALTNDERRLLRVREELAEALSDLNDLTKAPNLRETCESAVTSLDQVIWDIDEDMGWDDD